MTQPRSQIVQPERTRYYHCVARCVRRAWLCGEDDYTGKNFDHRKSWLLERMKLLGEVFAIRIAAYAVMSNHYHVVLYLDIEQGRSWDRDEVIGRWTRLFSGDPLARAYLRGGLDGAALGQVDSLAARWRERLCDLSWYMRCLNEHLARRANAEDGCKGRFWESQEGHPPTRSNGGARMGHPSWAKEKHRAPIQLSAFTFSPSLCPLPSFQCLSVNFPKTWHSASSSPIPSPSEPTVGGYSMTRPRSQIVQPERTRHYHCVARCVRRAGSAARGRLRRMRRRRCRRWVWTRCGGGC